MADNLHRVLEAIEALDLPEGDYIRVAGRLREAFNDAAQQIMRRFKDDREILLVIKHSGTDYALRIISSERVIYRGAVADTNSTIYEIITTPKDGTQIIKRYTSSHSRESIVKEWLCLWKPKKVELHTHLGFRVIHYSQAERRNTRYVKSMSKTLKSGVLPDTEKEHLEEIIAEYLVFSETDFYDYVYHSIPELR